MPSTDQVRREKHRATVVSALERAVTAAERGARGLSGPIDWRDIGVYYEVITLAEQAWFDLGKPSDPSLPAVFKRALEYARNPDNTLAYRFLIAVCDERGKS